MNIAILIELKHCVMKKRMLKFLNVWQLGLTCQKLGVVINMFLCKRLCTKLHEKFGFLL